MADEWTDWRGTCGQPDWEVSITVSGYDSEYNDDDDDVDDDDEDDCSESSSVVTRAPGGRIKPPAADAPARTLGQVPERPSVAGNCRSPFPLETYPANNSHFHLTSTLLRICITTC